MKNCNGILISIYVFVILFFMKRLLRHLLVEASGKGLLLP